MTGARFSKRSEPSAAEVIARLGIRRLVIDSRQVRPGDTFVAYPGESRDGRDYIRGAIGKGATSVLWDNDDATRRLRLPVPHLGIRDLRRRVGEIASELNGRPSSRLWVVGVTGTNGKTSCSQWIAQSLTRCGRRTAVIGTLGSGFAPRLAPTPNTTPDAVWLHSRLRELERQGARAACMEVSSHALAQDRASGVEFDVALLTNLTRDHLDYHGTMARYRAAKARLFRWPGLKCAVLNMDDRFGAELAESATRRGTRVLCYGFIGGSRARRAPRMDAVLGRNLRVGTEGVSFEVTSPWGNAKVRSPVIGHFNASNLLGSLATLLASDIGLEASVASLRRIAPVPGRTERYGGGRKPLVVVDYAHTPDALEKVLTALRAITREGGKLVCVFGCGGERDRGKRSLMGRAASRLADRVIITSDNPRSEDPRAIIADVLAGVLADCEVIVDRRLAIQTAVRDAESADVILVAGKGHEKYQEIGGIRRRFSDATVACAALGVRR